jgi:hypothetical protein
LQLGPHMNMENAALIALGSACFIGTIFCWRRIWASNDRPTFKIIFSLIAALPIFGPFLYLFVDMPRVGVPLGPQEPPRRPRPMSRVMRYWLEREHLFLSGAGCVFLALAVLAYWINGWSPGEIHSGLLGAYTDVDVIFYSLLILSVVSFGGAIRPAARVLREWEVERVQRQSAAQLASENRWWRRHAGRKKKSSPDSDAGSSGRESA